MKHKNIVEVPSGITQTFAPLFRRVHSLKPSGTLLAVALLASLLACIVPAAFSAGMVQGRYISELRVTFDSEPVPAGFTKIPTDLNKGAKGKFVYLCYRETSNPDEAIRGLKILSGQNATAPVGYARINRDLNSGAGGSFLYLAYTKDRSTGPPIREIKFDVSATSLAKRNASRMANGGLVLSTNLPPAQRYTHLETDLNKGSGGTFIYLMYR